MSARTATLQGDNVEIRNHTKINKKAIFYYSRKQLTIRVII